MGYGTHRQTRREEAASYKSTRSLAGMKGKRRLMVRRYAQTCRQKDTRGLAGREMSAGDRKRRARRKERHTPGRPLSGTASLSRFATPSCRPARSQMRKLAGAVQLALAMRLLAFDFALEHHAPYLSAV
eukprot:3270586-Rhodomonas_salina.1